jgi:hypothetical protein
MYFYCLGYTDHTYNNLNKQPKGNVSVVVIPTTLTIVWINNQKVLLLFLCYTDYTYNSLNKQPRATLSYTDQTYNSLNKQPKGIVIGLVIPITLKLILI